MAALSRQRLHFPATLEAASQATQAITAALPGRLTSRQRFDAELGLSELLSNIVRHGYRGKPDGWIRITWSEHKRRLEMSVADAGDPIPPEALAAAGPDTFSFDHTDLGQIPERGMGLSLVKVAFDRMGYRSKCGVNRMRLQMRIR